MGLFTALLRCLSMTAGGTTMLMSVTAVILSCTTTLTPLLVVDSADYLDVQA